MAALVTLLVVAVVFFLLHRLALWAEGRGWIYYRNKRGSALGNIMSGLDPIWNPASKHNQAEERRLQDDRDDEHDGAPPKMRGKRRA